MIRVLIGKEEEVMKETRRMRKEDKKNGRELQYLAVRLGEDYRAAILYSIAKREDRDSSDSSSSMSTVMEDS